MGIEYSRRWWELDHRIYGGITNTDTDLRNIWYPSSGFNGGHGTLIGYYNVGTQARRFGAMVPDKRLARALELGAQVHGPVYTRHVWASFSVDWASVEHSEGAWTEWPSQTDLRYKELLKPAGNIYFAGSHLSPRAFLATRGHGVGTGDRHVPAQQGHEPLTSAIAIGRLENGATISGSRRWAPSPPLSPRRPPDHLAGARSRSSWRRTWSLSYWMFLAALLVSGCRPSHRVWKYPFPQHAHGRCP
jgi:hypothetical protein